MNDAVNENAVQPSQASPTTAPASTGKPASSEVRVRLWPAWILLVLCVGAATAFFIWAGDDDYMAAMAVFFGIMGTGLSLILWWLFGSRLPWKTRGIGLGLLVVGTGLAMLVAEEKMRMLVVVNGVTAFLATMLVWMTAASWLGWTAQKWGTAFLGVIFFALAGVLQFHGFDGKMIPEVSLRWSTTSEDIAEAYWSKHSKGVADKAAEKPLVLADGDWPEFRGPMRDGVVRGVKIRRDWEMNRPKLLWKHPVGLGWSSFAVVGKYLFTQEQRRELETVVCYNADTGKEVWSHKVEARFSEALGGDGPRATPTFYDGRLYALGATGILSCLDAKTGKEFWSTNILDDAGADNIQWGMAGSPLVYDNMVVVCPGGEDGKTLVAYDRLSGKRVWSAGNDKAAYSSPQLSVLNGRRQVLIFSELFVAGHDPEDGAQLWKYKWVNENNSIQPRVIDDSSFIISSVFKGAARVKITLDVGKWNAKENWFSRRMKLYYNDMVSTGGYAYALDRGRLVCLDLKNGKQMWKEDGEYGTGQLLLIEDDDLLLILGEWGDVALVEPSSEGLREIGRFQAIEGKTWNHPVIAHGKLFVRNSAEAACFDISPTQ